MTEQRIYSVKYVESLLAEIGQLQNANAKLGKLGESLMLFEDKFYDEARALLKEITADSIQGQYLPCAVCGELNTPDHQCPANSMQEQPNG